MTRHALRSVWAVGSLMGATALMGGVLLMETGAAQDSAKGAGSAVVARGQYLVTAMGCNDCHTPWKMGEEGQPVPDMSRMLSGHPAGMPAPPPPKPEGPWIVSGSATMTAWAGPWGISYSPNLTPHETTGLGIWTEEMFIQALRSGKHMGQSRPIMPPMPWMWYGKLNDEDLKAVYAYLRSIPPIENLVPDYMPPAGAGE